MSERMKHEPNSYSSPEVVERIKSTLRHVRDELHEVVKFELVGDFYHWSLRADMEGDIYRAITAHEVVGGKVSYVFRGLRVEPDGEIFYRGCTIDEDHPELYSELVSEAKRQYSWAKSRQARQVELSQLVQKADATLKRLRSDYPDLRHNIRIHSQVNGTFSLTLHGLTEVQMLETINKFSQKGKSGE